MKTLSDFAGSLRAYLGNDTSAQKATAILQAAAAALRNLPTLHEWTYYRGYCHVNTVAAQTTGTITYTEATRTAVLAGATWPSWAAGAQLQVGTMVCDIAERVSNTDIVLVAGSTPDADQAAGTAYTIFQTVYDLPDGIVSLDRVLNATTNGNLTMSPGRDWLYGRVTGEGTGQPREYMFQGNEAGGQPKLSVWPPPDAVYRLDAPYRRRPIVGGIEAENKGTAAGTLSSSILTGTGTAFSAIHVGGVLRVSADTTAPTGIDGANPAVEEFRVLSVASPTSLAIDGTFGTTFAKVAYQISSWIDADVSHWDLLLRLGEKHLRAVLRMKPTEEEPMLYDEAVKAARSAEGQRSSARSVAGRPSRAFSLPGHPYRSE